MEVDNDWGLEAFLYRLRVLGSKPLSTSVDILKSIIRSNDLLWLYLA